jgi:hypothetical protein
MQARPGGITFIVWKWVSPTYRTVFTAEYVNVFRAMLRRCYAAKHRLVCITDDPAGVECETFPLWDDHAAVPNASSPLFPSCYRRLKIFDPAVQRALKIRPGERIVSMDLDVVLCGDLVPMLDRTEDFIGWRGIGTFVPVVYNGSLFSFRAGRFEWLWTEFDPVKSPQQARDARYFGSDQAYMSFRLNGSAPGWDVPDGVYSYARDFARTGGLSEPPPNARAIFFNGKRKPWEPATQAMASWIARYWRA